MHFFLIWSLNFPQEMDQTGSNRFCNMLMYALSKVLQHADVRYNLPPGSGLSTKYRGGSLFSVYNVFVICGALDEDYDEKLDRFLKWNPLRSFSWSPLLKTHKSSSHPQPSIHTHTHPVSSHFPHTCTHIHPICSKYSQLSWFAWKSTCPTTTILPPNRQSPTPRPYPSCQRSETKSPSSPHPSLQSIQSFSSLPSLIVRPLCRQRPGSGSCRRRQWPRSFCQRRRCREACRVPSRTHPMGHSCQGHKSHHQWSGAVVKKKKKKKKRISEIRMLLSVVK